MKMLRKEQVDWRLILFVLLLVLLPFILFSAPAAHAALPDVETDPGYVVVQNPDTLYESFPAAYSSFTIALAAIPTDTVYVVVDPGTQLNVAGGYGILDTLMFTPFAMALNPQEIKVKPWNDDLYEGFHTGTLTFSILTDAPEYTGISLPAAIWTIADNDLPPGINTLIITDTTFTEGLAGIDLLFALGSIPTDTVFITIDPDDQLRITAVPGEPVTIAYYPDASSLSFDGAAIRAVDDGIFEGDHTGTVSFSIVSDDPIYAAFSLDPITWNIHDNDAEPGLVLNFPPDTTLEEGLLGVDLLIRLASIPTDTVFITFDPDAQLRVTGLPDIPLTVFYPPTGAALAFDGVSVRAFDDYIFEGPHSGTLHITIVSDDPYYNAMTLPDIAFPIIDNDNPPGFSYAIPDTLEVSEDGGELPVIVALHSVPLDTVKIAVSPDDQLRIGDPGATVYMVFPPNASALNDHVVNVKAYDDADYEGTHSGTVTFDFITTDPDYAAMSIPSFTATIFDNDLVPGIIFLDTMGLAGVEGDTTLDIMIRLTSIPVGTVNIELQPDMQLDLGKGPGDLVKLKFRDDTALVFQLVKVKIVDDHLVEGAHTGIVTVTITTDDVNYSVMSVPSFDVAITDNDIVPVYNFNPQIFNVYPTIASDIVQVHAFVSGSLKVYDLNWQEVMKVPDIATSASLSVRDLQSGTYLFVWVDDTVRYYQRIIISH